MFYNLKRGAKLAIIVNSYSFSNQNTRQNPAFGARKIPLRVANKYKNRMLAQDVKENKCDMPCFP